MRKTITLEIEVPDEDTAMAAQAQAVVAVRLVQGIKSCAAILKPPEGSPMRLHVLIAKFPESSVPEVVRCWDQFSRDGNPEGYDEDMASGREQYPEAEYRQVVVKTVGLPEVFDTPEIEGELE